MGLSVVVVECRVTLGVYTDEMAVRGLEPHVWLGSCEGLAHVPALVKDMRAVADAEVGVCGRFDYFWSGSSLTRDLYVG